MAGGGGVGDSLRGCLPLSGARPSAPEPPRALLGSTGRFSGAPTGGVEGLDLGGRWAFARLPLPTGRVGLMNFVMTFGFWTDGGCE